MVRMTISTPDAASLTDPSAMDQGDPGSESRVGFDEVLDRLWLSELSRQEQGRRFERLAKRFLEVEPKFADQFSDVWLWNEWPGRETRCCGS